MVWTSAFNSTIAGYISILFWLVVFIPQLVENYKRRNGDGLSLTFLSIWLAGDLFNMAGIMMENLMLTMFLLALWYTVADICLIWQVLYYQQCSLSEVKRGEYEAIMPLKQKKLKQRRTSEDTRMLEKQAGLTDDDDTDLNDDLSDEEEEDNLIDPIPITQSPKKSKSIYVNVVGSTVLLGLVIASLYGYINLTSSTMGSDVTKDIRLLPQIFGWFSAILYIGSRVPQLIKNWRQQSTEGLSPGMFICAVFGNFFYALSIFLRSTERRYIIVNLPWIIGSLGTVIFDIMIFLQFYVFNRRKLKDRAD